MCNVWRNGENDLPHSFIVKLLSDAYELGARTFIPIGGECFVRNNFIDILEFADTCGYSCITFVTNATLLDENSIKRLSNIKSLTLNISIDGPEKIHDFFRGNGVYNKVLKNIALLRKYDVSFHLSSVVMKKTLPHLSHVIELAHEHHAPQISFQPFQKGMVNTDADMTDMIFQPEDEEYIHNSMKRLAETAEMLNVNIYTDKMLKHFAPFLCKNEFPQMKNGCSMPSRYVRVTKNGDVLPCFILSYLEPKMGNVYKKDLKYIWGNDIHGAYIDYAKNQKCSGCLMSCSDVKNF